jgi:hypothetical protein
VTLSLLDSSPSTPDPTARGVGVRPVAGIKGSSPAGWRLKLRRWPRRFSGVGSPFEQAFSENRRGCVGNKRIASVVWGSDNVCMVKRRIDDNELHAQFVTFSCYRRRRLLDHVHAIVWFPKAGHLSRMMRVWKSRSSRQLKQFVRGQLQQYAQAIEPKQGCDWCWSSARYDEQGKSVGAPITWVF